MADEQFHVRVSESNGVKVVRFTDRKILEELSISQIEEELSTLVDAVPAAKVLLCFEHVEHLSSAALGMLLRLDKKISEQGGELRLSDITPQIYEVFKITRLNKLFDIFGTAEQALASF